MQISSTASQLCFLVQLRFICWLHSPLTTLAPIPNQIKPCSDRRFICRAYIDIDIDIDTWIECVQSGLPPDCRVASRRVASRRLVQSLGSCRCACNMTGDLPTESTTAESQSDLNMNVDTPAKERDLDQSQLASASFTASAAAGSATAPAPAPAPVSSSASSADRHAHRQKVIAEVISTEQSYSANIHYLVTRYAQQLRAQASEIGLTPNQLETMFSNIDEIDELHLKLLDELVHVTSITQLCDLLSRYAPMMKCYSTFVNNYGDSSLRIVSLTETNKKFKAFLATARAEHPLDIASLQILPIQRIMRYSLLLNEIARHIKVDKGDDASDIERINQTLNVIVGVTQFVNENKRSAERTAAIVVIQSRLANVDHSFRLSLLQPHRKLLKDDKLLKRINFMTSNKRRLILFNDLIIVTGEKYKYKLHATLDQVTWSNSVSSHNNILNASNIANDQPSAADSAADGTVNSQQMTAAHQRTSSAVTSTNEANDNSLAFELILTQSQRRLVFHCETAADKQLWCAALKEAFAEFAALDTTKSESIESPSAAASVPSAGRFQSPSKSQSQIDETAQMHAMQGNRALSPPSATQIGSPVSPTSPLADDVDEADEHSAALLKPKRQLPQRPVKTLQPQESPHHMHSSSTPAIDKMTLTQLLHASAKSDHKSIPPKSMQSITETKSKSPASHSLANSASAAVLSTVGERKHKFDDAARKVVTMQRTTARLSGVLEQRRQQLDQVKSQAAAFLQQKSIPATPTPKSVSATKDASKAQTGAHSRRESSGLSSSASAGKLAVNGSPAATTNGLRKSPASSSLTPASNAPSKPSPISIASSKGMPPSLLRSSSLAAMLPAGNAASAIVTATKAVSPPRPTLIQTSGAATGTHSHASSVGVSPLSFEEQLSRAVKELAAISRSDMTALKHSKAPPLPVRRAIESVAILLDLKPTDDPLCLKPADPWKLIQSLLTKPTFLRILLDFNEAHAPLSDMTVARLAPYINDPKLHPRIVSICSPTAGTLYRWVRAYYCAQTQQTAELPLPPVTPKSSQQQAKVDAIVQRRMSQTKLGQTKIMRPSQSKSTLLHPSATDRPSTAQPGHRSNSSISRPSTASVTQPLHHAPPAAQMSASARIALMAEQRQLALLKSTSKKDLGVQQMQHSQSSAAVLHTGGAQNDTATATGTGTGTGQAQDKSNVGASQLKPNSYMVASALRSKAMTARASVAKLPTNSAPRGSGSNKTGAISKTGSVAASTASTTSTAQSATAAKTASRPASATTNAAASNASATKQPTDAQPKVESTESKSKPTESASRRTSQTKTKPVSKAPSQAVSKMVSPQVSQIPSPAVSKPASKHASAEASKQHSKNTTPR